MSATETPTPPPASPGPAPDPAPRRPAARVIALLTVALGAAVVVATAVGGIAPTLAMAGTVTETRAVSAEGVGALDLDVNSTSLSVRFADIDEATLDLRNATRGHWVFQREGNAIRVEAPRSFFFGWGRSNEGSAILTLPRELEDREVDVDLSFGAADATLTGAFGQLDVDMGAGALTATGSASALTVDVGAGRADLDLADVATADLSISAGEMVARLTGDVPDDVVASVSAGSLDLTLPEAEYALSSDVAAGDFDNGLRIDRTSSYRVSVEVAAGSARIVSD